MMIGARMKASIAGSRLSVCEGLQSENKRRSHLDRLMVGLK